MSNRINRRTNRQQPAPTTSDPAREPENVAVAAIGAESDAAEGVSNVHNLLSKSAMKAETNWLVGKAFEKSEGIRDKVVHLGEAKALLEKSRDLEMKAGGFDTEARSVAAEGALILFRDRAAGTLSADEVTETLGSVYGYKVTKATGKVSKTPAGIGEHLRKRIVRAAQAKAFVDGSNDFAKFFDGMDKSDVANSLLRLESDDLSIWSFYDDLANQKKGLASGGRIDPAFNVKTIAAIAAKLTEATAPDMLLDTPGLGDAYGVLLGVLVDIGTRVHAVEAERDAA